MENFVWVLGASDPEMAAIETLLRECGQTVVYATIDGRRVTPAEAYRADVMLCATRSFIRVECSWDGASGPVCDHHNPGDPGYGRPPAEFLQASSIGQVVSRLAKAQLLPTTWGTTGLRVSAFPRGRLELWDYDGRGKMVWTAGDRWLVPPEIVLVAAADHCLAAAYRGECPGVDPDAVMRWRAESRAKFQNRPLAEVLADVHKAEGALRIGQIVALDGGVIKTDEHGAEDPDGHHVRSWSVTARDMRGVHVPELPEASARLGMCFISDGLPGRDGRVKVVCQSGTPEQIEAFMRVFAPSIGLVDIYGDPARGFAGGYKSCAT